MVSAPSLSALSASLRERSCYTKFCTNRGRLHWGYIECKREHGRFWPYRTWTYIHVKLTCNSVSSDKLTAVSQASSILWDNYKSIFVAGAGEVRAEDVVCLCEVVAVGTGHGC